MAKSTTRFTALAAIAAAAVAACLVALGVAEEPAGAAFPGQNGKIAFVSDRDGNPEIYAMNPNGSGQTRLTTNTSNDFDPAWSPDGTKVAFASDRDGDYEIFVMNADGSNQKKVTKNAADDSQPTWSPNGTKIAFTRGGVLEDGGGIVFDGDIFTMRADGSNQKNLSNNAREDSEPAWSPDGTKIAFASEKSSGGSLREIFVMSSTDGSGRTSLTKNNGRNDRNPVWSPRGAKIAFTREVVHDPGFGVSNVFTMNADGSKQKNLTQSTPSEFDPAWSPNGTKIAFEGFGSGDNRTEIFVMSSKDGSGRTELTNNAVPDYDPNWQAL